MNPLQTLSLVLGAGFSSGLNLYATVATLGLLQRFGVIHLPAQLQVLSHPLVLGIAGVLYLVEFLADKIPYIDSVWQAIHTFISPPAAALLAFSATASAPRGLALGCRTACRQHCAHLARHQSQRARRSQYEPRAGQQLGPQFGEDVLSVWLTWFATAHPTAAIIVVVVLCAISLFMLYHLFRFLRRTLNKLAEI